MDSNLQNQIPFGKKLLNAVTNILGYDFEREQDAWFVKKLGSTLKISKDIPQSKTFMERLTLTPSSGTKTIALIIAIFLALIFIIILFDKIRIYFF